MSVQIDKCNLVLYYQDKRVSDTEWSETVEFSLSKQTAKRANSIISGYFQLKNTWDKKLFESVFSSDLQFNWFEFNGKENPLHAE